MRKTMGTLLAVVALSVGLAIPGAATGDETGVCPDDHALYPTLANDKAADKDRNNNGVVCRKYDPTDPASLFRPHGGPDDKSDDYLDDIPEVPVP